ncbi:predicted protein [Naegleria gruberi]|uniref:Predicted protein n=1 Tax=Naegleria gruberi TaxID=5762 RepID=D2VSU4_NAEGR|nr:uncharacterized protein NAEGRDRAFT_72063 [Naegleria gruberi]EFC40178.1 predicted protein [Naegleria gruberi]|eukprot:XP_002672922.1 predicted protein [Naegleria gruberi strain NEG-M]
MPKLTQEQLSDAEDAFRLFDKDSDGKIPIEELGKLIRVCGKNPSNKDVEKCSQEIDPSKLGYFTFSQLTSILESKTFVADNEQRVRECFKIFDRDGTGYAPLTEIRYALVNLGTGSDNLSSEQADEIFKSAETDDSGNLNYSMFVNFLMPSKF